jgi:xanthine dehydrogenase molybdopterin-binding subunit B
MTVIGTRLPRHEDPRLLRGRGRFGDDFSAQGQLWARIVRSGSAHGQVRGLDVAAALKVPGVATVVTANDLPPGLVIPVRLAIAGTDLSDFLQPVLAADAVRYVGEPLAVVVGDDPYACEDAAELVEIDIPDAPSTTTRTWRPNSPAATATPTPPSPPPRMSSGSSSPSAATAACRSSPAACWPCPPRTGASWKSSA